MSVILMGNRTRQIAGPTGFTLVEMAFVVILSGILFAALMQLYTIHIARQDYHNTIENMEMAQQALGEFFGLNGRYPCPSDPSLPPTDPNYGLEQCRADITQTCLAGPAPGGLTCADVLSRDANGDGALDRVIIGALPFNTLALNAVEVPFQTNHGFDGYGMKLSYAVSELMSDTALTVVNPANIQLGAIDVKDENGRDVVDPPSSAHYVIFSHGENSIGAFSKSGMGIGGCIVSGTSNPIPPGFNPGTPGIETERENCDNNDAAFVKGLQARTNDDNLYDDVLYFGTSGMTSLWRRSFFSPPTETYLYNTNFGSVGVGVNTPAQTLHVNNNVRAENQTEAENGYCDVLNSAVCLLPESLGGDPALGKGMVCPGSTINRVATGIDSNGLVCADLFTAPITFTCPPGEFVTSFSNLGTVTCSP